MWRWGQRLRRPEGCAHGHITERGRIVGGQSVHVAQSVRRVRGTGGARGPGRPGHVRRHIQVHGRLLAGAVRFRHDAVFDRQQLVRHAIPIHRPLHHIVVRVRHQPDARVRGPAGQTAARNVACLAAAAHVARRPAARLRRRAAGGLRRNPLQRLVCAVRRRARDQVARELRELCRVQHIRAPIHRPGAGLQQGPAVPPELPGQLVSVHHIGRHGGVHRVLVRLAVRVLAGHI